MGGSFAVLVAVMGAAPLNYEVSLRTEGRTGNTVVNTTTASTASFLELDPAAGLSTRFGALAIEAGYKPRLLYSLNIDHSLAVFHRGNVGGTWRLSKKTRLTFDEALSYGRNDFSPLLAVTITTVPDPRLPRVLILAYFGSTSTVGVTHSTLRGLELGGSATYTLSGGVDQLARSVLPLSRTGTVNGRVAYEITRSDALTSTALVSVTTFSTGAETLLGNAAVGWRRQFNKATQGDASAGISVTQSHQPGLPDAIGTGPSATLGVSHVPAFGRQQLRGTARVSYSAAVDPFGGGAYQRVEGSLGADYSPIGSLSFSLRVSGARAVSAPPGLKNGLGQVELGSTFAIDRHVSLSGGARTAWVYSQTPTPFQSGLAWAAFVGLTLQQGGKL